MNVNNIQANRVNYIFRETDADASTKSTSKREPLEKYA